MIEALLLRAFDDPIDVLEVFLVRLGGVVVGERLFAVGVGRVEPVEFGEDDGLNYSEAFLAAVLEVEFGVLAIEAVEEFPCGVTEPEERLAIGVLQIAVVIGDFEGPVSEVDGGLRSSEQRQKRESEVFHGLAMA